MIEFFFRDFAPYRLNVPSGDSKAGYVVCKARSIGPAIKSMAHHTGYEEGELDIRIQEDGRTREIRPGEMNVDIVGDMRLVVRHKASNEYKARGRDNSRSRPVAVKAVD
jgi:hypothetical protein